MEYPSVTIIILSYSAKDQLARCLEFIYVQEYPGQIQTIVVDNGSKDNSLLIVSSRYPQVKIIRNPVNLGIGTALNQAMIEAKGDYILTLHQDVEIRPDVVESLVRAISQDPMIGAACLLTIQRRSQASKLEVDSVGIGFRNGYPVRFFEGDVFSEDRFSETRYVFGGPGCCVLYTREMLEKIKINGEYFDEDLFACYEDYDVAMRAYLKGFKTVYAGGAIALHKRGIIREHDETAQTIKDILSVVNLRLIMNKNVPPDLWELNRKIIKRNYRHGKWELLKRYGLGVWLRATWHFWKNNSKMLKKSDMIFERSTFNLYNYERDIFGRK